MELLKRLQSRKVIFLHDLLIIPIAWFGAYWLRFNLGTIPEHHLNAAVKYLFLVVLMQTLVFRFFGLYRGVWRFASLPDLFRIMKAVTSGILIISIVLFLYDRLSGVPRSVIPLYGVLLLFLLCTPRFLYRYWKDNMRGTQLGKRAVIVGAGMAGEMLVRDLLRELDSSYYPVAFVDDDKRKKRREIHGIRVVGSCRKLPTLVKQIHAEIILIAVPSANDAEMRHIVALCEQSEVPYLTLPSAKDLLTGRITQRELKHVSIEDLLGRDPVRLDWEGIKRDLEGTTVMITGGGGSIGSELCKQIAKLRIERLIVFEKSEFNLYQIQSYLSLHAPNLSLESVLGDVVDSTSVDHAVKRYQPDIIFHAAAYKHVPLLQDQVCEAARNNILGTNIVAQAANNQGVDKFVLISTDKAVNPTSVMGATKRAAEVLCHSVNSASRTRFITVRFGNVLDSAGSVVPLFRDQIKSGGPVTVTHPDITRYFMTIPEACQLIMQAAAIGEGGEVFVLDMGEPVRISYLAEQMIRLSGKRPGEEIEITYTGLRPGEKMYEELFHEQAELEPTAHKKLLLSRSAFCKASLIKQNLEEIQQACSTFDEKHVFESLIRMVPEYVGSDDAQGNVVYLDPLGKSSVR